MAVTLTIYNGININNIAFISCPHSFYYNGCSVRYFLIKQSQQLFSYHFCGKNSFGLVCKRILIKKMSALLRKLFKLFLKLLNTASVLCRHRNYSFKIHHFTVSCKLKHKPCLIIHRIYLVYCQNSGNIHSLEFFDKLYFRITNILAGLSYHKTGIYTRNRSIYRAYHIFAKLIFRLVYSGGIYKNKLHLVFCKNSHNSCSGCLRLARNYCKLLTEHSVKKR